MPCLSLASKEFTNTFISVDNNLSFVQIHRLRELLDVPELTTFGAIPLLLDPEIKIKGIIVGTPEESM